MGIYRARIYEKDENRLVSETVIEQDGGDKNLSEKELARSMVYSRLGKDALLFNVTMKPMSIHEAKKYVYDHERMFRDNEIKRNGV